MLEKLDEMKCKLPSCSCRKITLEDFRAYFPGLYMNSPKLTNSDAYFMNFQY